MEDDAKPEGVNKGPSNRRAGGKNAEPSVEMVSIQGPYNAKSLGESPSREKIFVCHPAGSNDEENCARRILSALAHRAYRRPVTDADLQDLLSVYKAGRDDGGFEAGIETALERILVGPEFLFRVERDPSNAAAGSVYRISDLDLASRLSFFLWSTIPDDQLLGLAESGRLKEPAVLEQQVQRMLRDPRSKAFGQ